MAYLDLSNNSDLQTVYCSPQNISAPLAVKGSPSIFSFSQIMPAQYFASVVSDSVHGYSASGSIIDTTYDPSTGIATFTTTPAEIDYYYDTGRDDTQIYVNISVSDASSSSSSTTQQLYTPPAHGLSLTLSLAALFRRASLSHQQATS